MSTPTPTDPEVALSGGPVVQLPTAHGIFQAQAWHETVSGIEHLSVLVPVPDGATPLVRVHSECLTGDVFGSYRCDCGEQLDYALAQIQQHGGAVVYLRGQEGRGIGLSNKLRAYALQEAGADTVEANEQLGLPVDARSYGAAAAILNELGFSKITLLSNNPVKAERLRALGIDVAGTQPAEVPSRAENLRYLQTKRDKMHHQLTLAENNQVSSRLADGQLA